MAIVNKLTSLNDSNTLYFHYEISLSQIAHIYHPENLTKLHAVGDI